MRKTEIDLKRESVECDHIRDEKFHLERYGTSEVTIELWGRMSLNIELGSRRVDTSAGWASSVEYRGNRKKDRETAH